MPASAPPASRSWLREAVSETLRLLASRHGALSIVVLFAGASAVPTKLHAQEVAANPAPSKNTNALVYPATFYGRFNPQTAYDIIDRTPGFAVQSGDQVRGFGGAAGNVLVDGRRPTVKTGGIGEVLVRIPASRVDRVELLRGSQLADAQGYALVANIVLRPGGKAAGTASISLGRAPIDGAITPTAELYLSGPVAGWEMSGSLVASKARNPNSGRYELFDAQGILTDVLVERLASDSSGGTLTGAASRALGGGTLSLNGRLDRREGRYRQSLTPVLGSSDARQIDGKTRTWNSELGGDWSRPLGHDWTAKLVTLLRGDRGRSGEGNGISSFDQRSRTSEQVVRISTTQSGDHRIRPDLGGELTRNTFKSTLALVQARVPIPLQGSVVDVLEWRGEAFALVTAKLGRRWLLDAGMTMEASRIEVGDRADPRQNLAYWKPSAALMWNPSERLQIRLGLRRTVGQLDLGGFGARGNLIDDRPLAGSTRLRPEITDVVKFTFDRRFGSNSALNLTAAHETVRDALVYVPVESGGQALVNAGQVSIWKLKGEATMPLGFLFHGAQLTIDGNTVFASRRDPITDARRVDSQDHDELNLTYRHDVAAWRSAYGTNLSISSTRRDFFVTEEVRDLSRPTLGAFIETSLVKGYKLTTSIQSLIGEVEQRERRFFTPSRSGMLSGIERRRQNRGAFFNLQMSRSL